MTLEERKKELKKLALKNVSNGGTIYKMINEGKVDHIIKEINDEKTIPNVTCMVKKGYLTGNEQFLEILSSLLRYFERSFLSLERKEFHFTNMIKEYVPEFLLCKNYWGDNDFIPYYDHNIKKLLVSNVYENIKFVYEEYKEFFKTNGITLNMSLDKEKDVELLYQFVVNLVWCNCVGSQWYFNSVFANYKTRIIDLIDHNNMSEDNATDIVLREYTIHWNRLIDKYNNKIELVNSFLNLEY